MILPTKHIPIDRSLSGVGAEILVALSEPLSVSETWVKVRVSRIGQNKPITFDWFLLALSWLFSIFAVFLDGNLLSRRPSS